MYNDTISTRLFNTTENKTFKDDDLDFLLTSIQETGIDTPLTVTEAQNGKFDIADGHKRFYAAALLGIDMLPVAIVTA